MRSNFRAAFIGSVGLSGFRFRKVPDNIRSTSRQQRQAQRSLPAGDASPLRSIALSRKWLVGLVATAAVAVILLAATERIYRGHLLSDAIHRAETSQAIVALTFDDGPSPLITTKVLEVLDRKSAKATFFMVGKRIENYPEIAASVFENEHEIGNHAYSHQRLILMRPSTIQSEVERTNQLLRGLGVEGAIHFRPPFGVQLFALPFVLKRLQMTTVLHDVVPRDWETQDAELIAKRVLRDTRPGSIILLHDGAANRVIVRALPMIIDGLRNRGFRFVTVGELFALAAGEET